MIEFRSVSKKFPDGTVAVADFSFVFPSHKTTVLVGSSGCGKTTLLRMINRMVEPTSGQILIDDVNIASQDKVKLRRSIGYVLQAAGLLPHRKVLDNVATVPFLTGVGKAQARAAALELLDKVGLDRSLAGRYPRQLSGGQQQRVGVARALAGDPDILLMDEPFGAVDPIVRADLQLELNRLQRELGKTIVFVTHDIDEAFTLADQVVIFRKGGVIAQSGTP
ncbi:MAG: ATP-binding cassette domain-containing protein, partial [Nakamurella sp.]